MSDLSAAPVTPFDRPALRVRPLAMAMLALSGVAALAAFLWPLFLVPGAAVSQASQAPLVFAAILPALIAVVLTQLGSGGIDAKVLALLGVLTAIIAILRPLGAGTAGLETVFFLLILAGRVYGPAFGFLLGNTALSASALLTAGVGPWLPYQMMASGFVGLFAGMLPRLRGWGEVAMLALYGGVMAFTYGWLMDFAFWPFNLDASTELSYHAADTVGEKVHKFVLFNLATSMGWNAGRALTNIVLIAVVGRPLLAVLRRASRKAGFGASSAAPAGR